MKKVKKKKPGPKPRPESKLVERHVGLPREHVAWLEGLGERSFSAAVARCVREAYERGFDE